LKAERRKKRKIRRSGNMNSSLYERAWEREKDIEKINDFNLTLKLK
jgi:hypothetical protein